MQLDINQQKLFFETIIEQLPIGIVIGEAPEGNLICYNQIAVDILETNMSVPIREYTEQWTIYYPTMEPYKTEDLPLTRAICRGEVSRNVEMILRFGFNQFKWISVNAAPVFDHYNNIIAGVAVFSDITAMKESESVRKRVEELTKTNEELEQFAYIASHDLNDPLRKILSSINLLSEEVDYALSVDGKSYIYAMKHSAQRMQYLIRSLLELFRTDRKVIKFEFIDMNDVVKTVISDFNLQIQEKSAQIEVQELPIIEADLVQMHQLIQNLLSNALKYSKKNGTPVIKIFCRVISQKEEQQNIVEYPDILHQSEY